MRMQGADGVGPAGENGKRVREAGGKAENPGITWGKRSSRGKAMRVSTKKDSLIDEKTSRKGKNLEPHSTGTCQRRGVSNEWVTKSQKKHWEKISRSVEAIKDREK